MRDTHKIIIKSTVTLKLKLNFSVTEIDALNITGAKVNLTVGDVRELGQIRDEECQLHHT